MGKRGSETCPIDLTDDDFPSRKKSKRERTSITEDELRNLTFRVQCLEEKIASAASASQEGETQGALLSKNVAVDEFIVKCSNLENRLASIESCLTRLAQVFSVFSNSACVPSTNSSIRSHDLVGSLTNIHCESAEVQHSDSNDETILDGPSIANNQPVSQCNINTKSEVTNKNGHTRGAIKRQNTTNHVNSDHSENLNLPVTGSHRRCDGCPGCDTCTSVSRNDDGKPMTEDVLEDEELLERNRVDDLTGLDSGRRFIKQEIDLQRDDQGRILVTLGSSAKKLNKVSPHIVAVAGVYLTDDIHNEFIFESQRGMKDVKLEAEIRAALFGLETIKTLYQGSLNEVCVMIISSSQYLVQQMKGGRVYPNFYICSCEHRECEHSERRWISEEPLGKTQISVLPDLMVASKSVRVHWCKTDQLSPEEQISVNSYRSSVDTLLDVHLGLKRKKRNGTN